MSTTVINPPVAPRRWPLRLVLAAAVLLLALWAAPIIAAWTPVLGWLTQRADANIGGSVHVGSASLGWFSPVILYNVEVRDDADQVLAHFPKLESEHTLLRLVLNRNDLGAFRADKPEFELTFTGNDSNLEKLLAKAMQRPETEPVDQPATARPLSALQMDVVDANIRIFDADTKAIWNITGVSLSATVDQETMRLNVTGSLHDGVDIGALKVDAYMKNREDATLKARFTCLPLTLANVFVRRYQPGTELAGSLQGTCDVRATFKDGKSALDATAELAGNRVTVTSPHLAEPLLVKNIDVPLTLRLENQRLIAQRADVQCELGKLSARGTLDFNTNGLAVFDQPDFDLSFDVNLPTLLERLPKTLHAHPDLRLATGVLHAECKSEAKPGGPVWRGRLHVSDVRGRKGQQPLEWNEPILVEFQARDLSKGVPLVDQLKCTSHFLNIEGSQSPDRFDVKAEADLDRLAAPLSQFVDLSGIALAGKAKANVAVRRIDKDQFRVDGDALLAEVHLTGFTKIPLQEERVAVKLEAQGQLAADGKQRVESADVSVNLGPDSLVLKLTEPIADIAAGPWGAANVRVEGDLERWRSRVRSWTTLLDPFQFAGQAKVALTVRPTKDAIECSSAKLQATGFRFVGLGMRLQEPTFDVQTAGRWDVGRNALELAKTTVTCPTARIDADKFAIDLGTLAMRGAANVTGDLARLRQWMTSPGTPLHGTLAGRIALNSAKDRYTADFNMTAKNVVYGPVANPTWREAEVKCVGRGSYDLVKDRIEIETMHLGAAQLRADAKGSVGSLTTTCDLDLTGALTYDLEKLEPQLRPFLGKDVKIVGKDTRAFQLAGPLYPKAKTNILTVSNSGAASPVLRFTELKGDASVHWKSLQAHGCDVGAAEVKAILQQGWLQIYPVETTLNGGKLRLQPNLRLDPDPTELILLAGPTIEKAKLTPKMCSGALGYAAPALANVSQADGLISVTLEGGRIPLATPTTGELKGTLTLHSATLGPSPLIRELSLLMKVATQTSTIKESKVPFHMVGGKVHHRHLEISFGDFAVKSSGAVGLDGTLALVIETPVPPRLAALARLTPVQAKQTLRIPIGGTLQQPRPDPRALDSITSTIGRSILENELEKLLQPKR